jgi:transposase-like protein
MNRIPKVDYSKEIRQVAVEPAKAVRPSEASRRLSIRLKTLLNWKRAANAGTLAEVGKQHPPMREAELELAKVKREMAAIQMERELLKRLQPTSQGGSGVVPGHRYAANAISVGGSREK